VIAFLFAGDCIRFFPTNQNGFEVTLTPLPIALLQQETSEDIPWPNNVWGFP